MFSCSLPLRYSSALFTSLSGIVEEAVAVASASAAAAAVELRCNINSNETSVNPIAFAYTYCVLVLEGMRVHTQTRIPCAGGGGKKKIDCKKSQLGICTISGFCAKRIPCAWKQMLEGILSESFVFPLFHRCSTRAQHRALHSSMYMLGKQKVSYLRARRPQQQWI